MKISFKGKAMNDKAFFEIVREIEHQNTTDREYSNTTYHISGEYGEYIFKIKADEYEVTKINVTVLNSNY